MRRRLNRNLALAGLVAALAAGLWFLPRAHDIPTPAAPIVARASAAIARIRIVGDGARIELTRGDDHVWRLRRPVSARGDPARIAALLALAGRRPERRFAPSAIDTATTGLAEPLFTVRFDDAAPIAVGGPGPTPGSRYLRLDDAVVLVAAPNLGALAGSWAGWIDPTLLPEHARLTELALPDYTLARDAGGAWRVVSAAADRRAHAARATAAAWQRVRALAVAPAAAGRAPIGAIRCQFADAAPRRFQLIERAPNLILRDPRLGVDYYLAGNRVPPLLDLRHPALAAGRAAP